MKYPIKDVELSADSLGITAISFVKFPAICQSLTAFSDEVLRLTIEDEDKHVVIAPAMIPNQLILRQTMWGDLYYIRFSEEFVADCMLLNWVSGFSHNVTLEHSWFETFEGNYEDSFIKGIECTNMWLTEGKNDLMHRLGYNLPDGSLCCRYQVNNEELWRMIKDKTVTGLSIELDCCIKNKKLNA